jgi:DNA mismatch repair protein MutS2
MTNVVHIINQSTRKSLVLLDELGGSTDPIEGSALACSILQHFLKQGTKTVATTHYSNLKTFAYSNSGLRNASFDFDPDTLMPTYHLTIGIPGGSNALATANRLGLPPDIITGAKEMISTGAMDLNELLTDLMKEKHKVEELHFEINKQSNALREKRTEWEEKIKVLQEIERNLSQEGRDRVIRKSAELEKEIRQAISALKKERSKQGIQKARKAISGIEKRLTEINTELPVLANVDEDEDNHDEIKIGDKVQIRGTNAIAEVISIADKSNQFQIQIGQTKLWLRQDSFEKIEATEDAAAKPRKITVKKELQNHSVSLELNLRGKRAEEVEWALESYLSNAIMANLKQVSIIHGYGTGTVRSITREFLAGSPLVKSFRSGELNEGGDGVTIVNL